jgi:hypothetical protein
MSVCLFLHIIYCTDDRKEQKSQLNDRNNIHFHNCTKTSGIFNLHIDCSACKKKYIYIYKWWGGSDGVQTSEKCFKMWTEHTKSTTWEVNYYISDVLGYLHHAFPFLHSDGSWHLIWRVFCDVFIVF